MECWGYAYYGQLGNGVDTTTTFYTQPQSVQGLPAGNITSISVGYFHVCVVVDGNDRRDGSYANSTAWCWGSNTYGQIGDGTTTQRNTATKVEGLPGNVTSIEAAYHGTCAILAQGSVYCWGSGAYGQRGDDSTTTATQTSATTPVAVQGLGDETYYDENRGTVKIEGQMQVTQISMGYYNVLALTTTGKVYAWGLNTYGCLGDQTETARATAVEVTTIPDQYVVTHVSAGYLTSCASTMDGASFCWGGGGYGQRELGYARPTHY